MEGCVLFYCTEFTRVDDVRELDSGELVAVIVPDMSDFGSGTALWRITQHGDRSRLVYEAQIQPDFFVPSLIGSYFVKHKLKAELLTVFQRIECNAKARLQVEMIGNDDAFGDKENSMIC
jgi:abortive infection bacteriophage resistance protein